MQLQVAEILCLIKDLSEWNSLLSNNDDRDIYVKASDNKPSKLSNINPVNRYRRGVQ